MGVIYGAFCGVWEETGGGIMVGGAAEGNTTSKGHSVLGTWNCEIVVGLKD